MTANVLLVALGGALGSVLRYGLGLLGARLLGAGFPHGTLFVNLTGSFAMGLLVEVLARRYAGSDAAVRLFLATGVLGGYTTFSTFSLDVASLAQRGDLLLAALYLSASVVLGIAALFAGLALGRHLF